MAKKKKAKKSSIFDDLKEELPKSQSVGYNALKNLQKNSENVLGDFTNSLLNDTTTISDKIALIQSLENIALAEAVKAFDRKTRDDDKLMASNRLLSLSRSMKATIKEKHNLEKQELVDFTNPKFSKSFSFLLELFIKILRDSGVDGSQLLRVVDTLTVVTEDFEDKLNNLFNGIPMNKVEGVKNPFLEDERAEVLGYVELEDLQVQDAEIVPEEELSKKEKRAIRRAKRKKK